MMRGMYSAISGLRNHQIMLDVTANDLANVNTVGFKASRTSFRDSLAQLQRSGASATTGNAGAKSAQIGLHTWRLIELAIDLGSRQLALLERHAVE